MSSEFTGRILHVNLTTGSVEIETPPESFYRTYLGGSAMGLYYILRDVPAGTDGLDPANVLTMMDSLLTGAPIAGQSRITISARSPLTDGIGDSQGGGFFPAELRFAGFTGIVVKGRSPEPVYLWVHDGEAELRPAGHLWGKTTSQTTDSSRPSSTTTRIEVAAIGPAGEKAVPPGRDHEHGQPGERPDGHGRRDGVQEPQGGRRPRARPARSRWSTPRRSASSRSGAPRRSRTTATSSTSGSTAPRACSRGSTPRAACRRSTTAPASSRATRRSAARR